MKLKVCGMRDSENLRELFDQVNPDFVGFIFHPGSPRYFLDGSEDIPDELPPEKRTGVFVNNSMEDIVGEAEYFDIRNIQLHGSESPEFCRMLREKGFTIIKAFGIKSEDDFQTLEDYKAVCDFFLFDTKTPKHGGSGKKFNWDILDKVDISKPYFLSGGIDLEDVDAMLNLKQMPFAIDINSRFEIEPGLKNIQKISAFKNKFINHANT